MVSKIISKKLSEIIAFMESNKYLVGLSGWKLLVANESKEMDTNLAEITVDIYEKSLKLVLSHKFFKKSLKEQNNILLHELVHGRICVFNERVRELTEIEEEHLANDLTRGLEINLK